MRITPIENKNDVDVSQHEEFDRIVAVLGVVGGPFSALMHSPGLAERVMASGAHIRLESSLTPKVRQLAIAALARQLNCDFEWHAHYENALRAGVSEASLEAIRNRNIHLLADRQEQAVVQFVDDLVGKNRVSSALFDELRSEHGERWLVELTATVGQYLYIGAILNAFEIQPHAREGIVHRL